MAKKCFFLFLNAGPVMLSNLSMISMVSVKLSDFKIVKRHGIDVNVSWNSLSPKALFKSFMAVK